MLGDIILAHGVCAAEAADKAIPIESHAAHLMVHGTLHLLGYDHEDEAAGRRHGSARDPRAGADRDRRSLCGRGDRLMATARPDEGRIAAVARDARADLRRRRRDHAARPDRGSDRRGRGRAPDQRRPYPRTSGRCCATCCISATAPRAKSRSPAATSSRCPTRSASKISSPPSPRPGTAACRSIADALDQVIGMIHIKDVFVAQAATRRRPRRSQA